MVLGECASHGARCVKLTGNASSNVLKLRKAAREQGLDAPAPARVDQASVRNGRRQEAPLAPIPRRTKLAIRKSLPERPARPPTPEPEPVQPVAQVKLDPKQAYERKWKVGARLNLRIMCSCSTLAVLCK